MKRNSSLNHVFRLIWNQATGAWVAVAETTRGRGKASSVSSGVASAVLGAASLGLMLLGAPARAAPQGGQVTAGSASVSHSGATTTISQNSQNVSLSWQSFNIGKSETVNFVQPTARSIAVNRIFDTHGSQIFGHLNANGQVWLINPNGLLFGRDAQVNVGGLVASTLDVSDDSLSGSTHRFAGSSTAGVINQGHISSADGGSVVLLGHHVNNTGTISARLGTVALGAGNATTLQFEGNRLVNLRVDENVLDALADNGGLLQADGGQVLMSAGARNSVLASVVNNTGVIEARTVEQSAGRIVLLGGMAAGTTHVAGTLDASAPQGGNGGFIETSAAHVQVADGTRITTAAPRGQTGTWLIDPPVDGFVIAAEGGDISGETLSSNLGLTDVTIHSVGSHGGARGDIDVNDAVSWSAHTLTLSAYNDIHLNALLSGTTADAHLALEYGQSALALGNTAQVHYTVAPSLTAGSTVSTRLGYDVSATVYQVITALDALQGIGADSVKLSGNYALGANIDATATAEWNGGAGFVPIGDNGDIIASFSGSFNGLGHTIDRLTINQAADNVGLFGFTAAGSTISHVGLTDTAITGNYNVGGLVGSSRSAICNSYATGSISGTQYVGGLVGFNAGAIANSHATGSVSGTAVSIGGLVGNNAGTVSNSYATGSVIGTFNVGGLVGSNSTDSTISNSYASGSVSGNGAIGGLLGANYAQGGISASFWDTTTTGQSAGIGQGNADGAIGLSTTDALKQGSYTGFDFTTTWYMVEGSTRPFLRAEYSTTITNAHQLQLMGMNLTAHYTLANNIDLAAELANASGMWGGMARPDSAGFAPIGNAVTAFTGSLDGQGHTIAHLTIHRSLTDYVGLFGVAFTGSVISNVGLTEADITGALEVGGLAGINYGTVSNSYTTGTVSGFGYVGALVGDNVGGIADSYATGSVGGSVSVGGLVGVNEGVVINSHATGSVSGHDNVGGLVGLNQGSGIITHSHAAGGVVDPRDLLLTAISSGDLPGFISGNDNVGGLVGHNSGAISDSHAANNVSGNNNVGGLVGYNEGGISTSYAAGSGLSGPLLDYIASLSLTQIDPLTASVRGNIATGGLVGFNGGSGAITDSYATGSVNGSKENVGGLVGDNRGTIERTYASGSVSSTNGYAQLGGLVGFSDKDNGAYIGSSFWDTTTTGQVHGVGNLDNAISGATGLLTADALAQTSYTGFDFTNRGSWYMVDGSTRPFLRMEHSTTITNARQLQMMGMDLTAHYTLANDIDLAAELSNASGMWGGSAAGFAPIGDGRNAFTGSFDGQGHTIGHLTIKRTSNDVGLFGYADNGSNISHVGLTDTSISGVSKVGGLVGRNYAAISDSYATGSVSSTDAGAFVGGLVGVNYGAISESSATSSVSGTYFVGGLVGGSYGAISDSYATGSVSGTSHVGGLVGFSLGDISKSYATGSVSGTKDVGGLVGYTEGTISNSYATGKVSGTGIEVGGLVGYNEGGISNSYATGSVSSTGNSVGGLVGFSAGSISNSYATGSVSGTSYVGGLVGNNEGTISNSYATGSVSGTSYVGGLVGSNNGGNVSNSYWDIDTTGQSVGIGGPSASQTGVTGLSTAEALEQESRYAGFDFDPVTGSWYMVEGSTRPFLRMEYSTTISNAHQLQLMAMDRTAHYTLANSIDMGPELTNASGMWGGMARADSAGFAPIGTFDELDFSKGFTGSFDGQGHTIAHLTIRRNTTDYVGLFGFASYGSNISNVGMTDVEITGNEAAGGLVGDNDGAISNSYATGSVRGTKYVGGLVGINYDGRISNSYATASASGSSSVGGLVGDNRSSITNSYATGSASGFQYVGGLVGDNSRDGTVIGTISHSYATGSVFGFDTTVGGLVGANSNSSTISNSHWDAETTGQTVGIASGDQSGATALSTADALRQSNYGGFDFDTTWYMVDGSTRPFLRMEHSTTITNAHQLQLMGMDLGAHYTLANNIDLAAELADKSGMWGGSAAGFAPIGGIGSILPNILGADLGNRTALMNGNSPDLSALGNWGTAAASVNAMSVLDGLGVFSGSFDGQGHTIGHLTINRLDSIGVGLFGAAIGADIRNVGLTDASVVGLLGAGGLVGINALGRISDSYVTGQVGGLALAGGLVGLQLAGTINDSHASGTFVGALGAGGLVGGQALSLVQDSYASGTVVGLLGGGGLVGINLLGAVSTSYADAEVNGFLFVGGLVGINLIGLVDNSYATGGVSGSDYVGGLVGGNPGLIRNSYASGLVASGGAHIGGLAGGGLGDLLGLDLGISGQVIGSYWDMDSSGQAVGIGGPFAAQTGVTGLSNDMNLSSARALTQDSYVDWDFNTTWYMVDGSTRPFLRMEHSTTISNAHQLQLMSLDLSAHYTLANSIDLGPELSKASGMWGSNSAGFVPIGDNVTAFTGSFDGQGHTIGHLTIDRSDTHYVGLFGIAETGSAISNVGLTDVAINGATNVGALAGYSAGTIRNSYASGGVEGTYVVGGLVGVVTGSGSVTTSYSSADVSGTDYIGGLVGINSGSTSSSYATGSVNGNQYVGGLVGDSNGTISNTYASGKVSGSASIGGLVGTNSGTLTNSFWDIDSSEQAFGVGSDHDATGVIGLTTAQALTQASYAGFDFVNTWYTVDGSTRPFLRMEHSTTITNAHQLQLMGLDLTAHYTLANDLDLGAELNNASSMWGGMARDQSAGFVAIGTYVDDSSRGFTGSFDGQGHTIHDLAIRQTTPGSVGLFGYASQGSAISNVSLTNVDVRGQNYVGGLVGFNVGSVTNNAVTGSVSGEQYVGGLAGYNTGTLSDDHYSGKVSGTDGIGGVVGLNQFGSITHSDATGEVWGDKGVGGLVGMNVGGHISSSHATNAVNATQLLVFQEITVQTASPGSGFVGGLVGINVSGSIHDSYATGDVWGADSVGGLVGSNFEGTISGSYATGAVTGVLPVPVGSNVLSPQDSLYTPVAGIGGLVGSNIAGAISDSYATGAVSGDTAVGGLVGSHGFGGYMKYACSMHPSCGEPPPNATITHSYATGSVSGNTDVGGLVGMNDAGTVTDSYWNITSTGQANSAGGGVGLTQAQMTARASYAGWDFDNTWVIYEGHTAPLLRSFMTALTVTVDYAGATKVYDGTDVYRGGTVIDPANHLYGLDEVTGTLSSRHVGSRTVEASGGLYSDQQGYIISYATSENNTVEVTPATLTYRATPTTRFTGQAPTGMSGTVEGWMGDDTLASATTGSMSWTSLALRNSAPGRYDITGGGLTAEDYVFVQHEGNATALTLNPARLPDEVSAVTTQLASLEPVFKTDKAGAPSASRGDLRLRTIGSGVRLPDNAVSSETTE